MTGAAEFRGRHLAERGLDVGHDGTSVLVEEIASGPLSQGTRPDLGQRGLNSQLELVSQHPQQGRISLDVEKHGVHLGGGEVLEYDPPRRLVHTMECEWDDDVRAEGTSRVTWEIETVGDDSCQLTLTHDQMREGANSQIYGGWPMILSGLKTWLETGELLTTPGSLMYG